LQGLYKKAIYVLLNGTGTVGRITIIETTPENWNIKEGIYVIKPRHKVSPPLHLNPIQQFFHKISITHCLRLSFLALFSKALMVFRYSSSTCSSRISLF
jgi:hypothetical protein